MMIPSGTKKLVDEIELNLPDDYEKVGRHLTKWIPKPPKITPMKDEAAVDTAMQ